MNTGRGAMRNREGNGPLVAFTALSPIAVGGLAGLLLARRTSPVAQDGPALVLLAVALLALLASTLHLGRPFRAYRAIARLSTSWLSREVVLFGGFVALLAAYAVLDPADWSRARDAVGGLAVGVGAISLWATGRVYRLAARPAWNRWETVGSLMLGALGPGLLLGVFLAWAGGTSAGEGLAVVRAVGGMSLLFAAGLSWSRSGAGRPETAVDEPAWASLRAACRPLLALRIASTLGALALLLAPGAFSVFAWLPAALGELADRALFFRAVVPISMARRAGVLPFDPVPAPAPRPVGK